MKKLLRTSFAILAGTLACGVPLWPLAYRDVSLLERPHPGLWLMLGVSAVRALRGIPRRRDRPVHAADGTNVMHEVLDP